MRLWWQRVRGRRLSEGEQARLDAEQRLTETRERWPQVMQARDRFAAELVIAMRGRP